MNLAIMKMELTQTVGIKAKVEYALDLLIEILRSVRDYSVFHEINFGETLFFLYVLGRTLWYLTVGVESTFSYYLTEQTWTGVFLACSLFHFAAFFFKGTKIRASVILVYAVIWAFLALLAAIAQTKTPAVPGYSVFALGSVYVAVCLWTEKRD